MLSAPVQLLLYAGDRFLAADFETARLAATASLEHDRDAALYLIRAHNLITQLNPCHEDNYYLGNALLSWGGAEKEGSILLQRATDCRHWDWVPPFFYGFNQFYFHRDAKAAVKNLELAAQRSPENYASLMKSAAMIMANEFNDELAAINYLKQQRDQATDKKLHKMLASRVIRLEGLMTLRNAHKRYKEQFARPLTSPDELITHGFLTQLPEDPLGLGYELTNGRFQLRNFTIAGSEK